MSSTMTHFVYRKQAVESDWKLHALPRERNNGRKLLVNEIYSGGERQAANPEWSPAPEGQKTPVVETGSGGVEVATFTHEANQDCHKHLIGTEIYTVLSGKMAIRVNGDRVDLAEGDEIVVFPGAEHEVLGERTQFLTRVHSINCAGNQDKYVLKDGQWRSVHTLKNTEGS